MNEEKRYIPGTNPKCGIELPDGYSNSLVSKDGQNQDDGYNFDEKDDPEDQEGPKPEDEPTGWDEIAEKANK